MFLSLCRTFWGQGKRKQVRLGVRGEGGVLIRSKAAKIGALFIRAGFGVYYTKNIIRNPQYPILIIKAPTLTEQKLTERRKSGRIMDQA